MHGPVAAIGPDWPVFAVAPSGPAFASMELAVGEIAARGARMIIASDNEQLLSRADVPFPLLGGAPEWLSPITAVVPGQFAALRLARLRGIDLDRPLGLSKVTLTR
jgi:glucosamine--fructose-6-phosphate aminotransferase (isomerizing)